MYTDRLIEVFKEASIHNWPLWILERDVNKITESIYIEGYREGREDGYEEGLNDRDVDYYD